MIYAITLVVPDPEADHDHRYREESRVDESSGVPLRQDYLRCSVCGHEYEVNRVDIDLNIAELSWNGDKELRVVAEG